MIALDLERNLALIGGTEYAGEIKKALFTVMNYLRRARELAGHFRRNFERFAGDLPRSALDAGPRAS